MGLKGGMIRDPEIRFEGEERNKSIQKMVVWGTVSRNAVEKCYNKPFCEFGIKIRKGEFIPVICWGDHPDYATARLLEQGDPVMVVGDYRDIIYHTRHDSKYSNAGEEKHRKEFELAFLALSPASMLEIVKRDAEQKDETADQMFDAEDEYANLESVFDTGNTALPY